MTNKQLERRCANVNNITDKNRTIKLILKLNINFSINDFAILFAVSIVQINLLVDTLIASFLKTGSISWLYFL